MTRSTRTLLVVFHGGACAYCKAPLPRLWQVEHIIPKARGGTDALANLVPSCGPCNQAKADRTATEFGYPRVAEQAARNASLLLDFKKRDWLAVQVVKNILRSVKR